MARRITRPPPAFGQPAQAERGFQMQMEFNFGKFADELQ